MKKKQIIILGMILGVLLAGTALKILVRKSDSRTMREAQLFGDTAFHFEPGAVERILLGNGTKTSVELVKVNGRWEVESRWRVAAMEGKVINFLEKIRGIRWELRAKGENFLPDFGISDEEAYFIRLMGAGKTPLPDLMVGTKPAGSSGHFLRRASSDEIYFTDTNMAELFGILRGFPGPVPSGDYWADLALFNINIDRVLSVVAERFTEGKERVPVLGIRRESIGSDPSKNPWHFTRGENVAKTVDPEKALKLFVMLDSIRGRTVLDPNGNDYGLDAPVLEIAVLEKDRPEVRVTVSPKNAEGDAYFVKFSNRQQVFKLSANDFQDMDIKDEQLLKEAPAAQASPKAP